MLRWSLVFNSFLEISKFQNFVPSLLLEKWNSITFITICKSKKVKLINISFGVIPETHSSLYKNVQANTRKYYPQHLVIMDKMRYLQFIKKSGGMTKICFNRYGTTHMTTYFSSDRFINSYFDDCISLAEKRLAFRVSYWPNDKMRRSGD